MSTKTRFEEEAKGNSEMAYLKKCVKLHWNFQRGWGWGVLQKIPSVEKVWIFSGTTQYWIGQNFYNGSSSIVKVVQVCRGLW